MGNRKGCCASDIHRQTRRTDDVDIAHRDEPAGTENRIAVERQRYNDAVQDYNTYIGLFPNNIFARWAGFLRNNAYFTASEASREVPKVQFPGPGR
jgi:LemA protein